MPTYPALRVKADSQNVISTDGRNDVTGGYALVSLVGIALTSATAVCYLSITPGTITRAAMLYISQGVWSYVVPSTAFPANRGPWTVKVEVFDEAGLTGSLIRTLYATAREVD